MYFCTLTTQTIFMKKLLLPTLICFINILHAQYPNIKYTQELAHSPTMGCCPNTPLPRYEVVFRDDFEEGPLNATEWSDNFLDDNDRFYFENNLEPLYFGKEGENIFVNDGTLKLVADNLVPYKTVNGKDVKYSVGQIWSKQQWRYGKFECRFKISQGEAIFPAFWMQSHTGNGYDEIDIFEAFGHWGEGNDPFLNYRSGGTLNSASGSYDSYTGTQVDATHIAELTANEWHIATLEWTPYFLKVTIDGILTNEQYRYYKVCDGIKVPVKCENDDSNDCLETKYIENMAFPDDYMNVTFWMNLIPVYEWDPDHPLISETNTPFPAIAEIDYIEVQQLPHGTWKDCENKLFCTYSVHGYKEDNINICSDGTFAAPKNFTMYPSNSLWSDFTFTTSNNVNGIVSDNSVALVAPYPTEGDGWFQFEIPENANANCIGQDRILRKNLIFNAIDNIVVSLDGKIYNSETLIYINEGIHTIKIETPNNPTLNYEIVINGVTHSANELTYNFISDNSYQITFTSYENILCKSNATLFITVPCTLPDLYIDNRPSYMHFPLTFPSHLELCYGNHTFSASSDWQISEAWLMHNAVNGTPLQITNNSIQISTSILEGESYYLVLNKPGCSNPIYIAFNVEGICCLPDDPCNGACILEAHPNPVSQTLTVNANGSGISPTGEEYIPLISEINIYNRYMQPVRRIAGINLANYILDVTELINNEFYIVEAKDQYGNACRKTIMVSR